MPTAQNMVTANPPRVLDVAAGVILPTLPYFGALVAFILFVTSPFLAVDRACSLAAMLGAVSSTNPR